MKECTNFRPSTMIEMIWIFILLRVLESLAMSDKMRTFVVNVEDLDKQAQESQTQLDFAIQLNQVRIDPTSGVTA